MKVTSIRLNEEELNAIRKIAIEGNVSMWIREVIRKALKEAK